ncbi:MAG: nuclear transport factor 2 family protein [Candidatus Eremiobacteraeota bacterium]|nr:nuclear transport factor 2 family protein [Candidatus Eremiobacteraeota bacterium]
MEGLRIAPVRVCTAPARLRFFLLALIACSVVIGLAASHAAAPARAPGSAPAVVQSYVVAFNKHDLNAAMALVADDFVEVFADGNIVAGKEQQRGAVASVFAGSPHVTMIMDHLVGDDFTAAAQMSISAAPPQGPPPAAQYAYFFSVANGKILAIAVYGRSAQAQKAAGAK